MDIKNQNIVLSKITEGKISTLTIQNKIEDGSLTKLGHVFNYLPPGIIDKTITGSGGTTLELDCNRNSIVVEPLKITAVSKSETPSFNNKYRIFYFGFNYKKVLSNLLSTQGMFVTEDTKIQFDDYIKYCADNCQPIKITCVSDQLLQLKKYIDEYDGIDFNAFHLLLDEIDSMQEQSSFRDSMHQCMKIYIDHPKEKRSVLSATISKFHDPDLEDELVTKINYEDPIKLEIELLISQNIQFRTIETIKEILKNHPDEKILIAYNYIKGIDAIVKELEKGIVSKEDIAILCSSSNSEPVKGYIRSEIKKSRLSAKINFITAAYFNGFDLLDNAHLIIAIDPGVMSLAINAKTAYQICGRLRKGALSIKLICNFNNSRYNFFNLVELQSAIPTLKKFIDSVKEAQDSNISYLVSFGKELSKWLNNGNDQYGSIISQSDTGLEISYIKVDSLIVQNDTFKELKTEQSFTKTLKDYFIVKNKENYNDLKSTTIIETPEIINTLIKELSKTGSKNTSKNNSDFNGVYSKKIINNYYSALKCQIINEKKLLSAIKIIIKSEDWKTQLKYLDYHFQFHLLITSNDKLSIDKLLSNYFCNNKTVSTKDFNDKRDSFLKILVDVTKNEKKDIIRAVKNISNMKSFEQSLVKINSDKQNSVRVKKVKTLNIFNIINLNMCPELNMKKNKK